MSKPNNPPAFPQSLEIHVPEGGAYTRIESMPGMTLRDYFAAKAIPAIYAQVMNNPDKSGKTLGADYMAACCYILADAMLEERAK